MKNKIKISPRGKWVLVEPDKQKSGESENGIFTPSNVEEEQKSIGTVRGIGRFIDDIKIGDRVIYGAFAGEKVSLNSSKKVDYILLMDEDIIAFIN